MTEFNPQFFDQAYNRDDFLHFLRVFLGDVLEISLSDFSHTDYKTIISAQQIATHSDLNISIIEITHNTKDARVAIARDAFTLMADHNIDNALIIFKNDTPNYRFSLLTIDLEESSSGKIKNIYSNPRRYSFFLGEEAKVHTPFQQLIKKGPVKDFTDLQERFSVEVVNKEFYRTLVNFFNRLIGSSGTVAELELPDIDVEKRKQFAMRLIGRIIFTWFLKQKKSQKGSLVPEEILSSQAVTSKKYVGGYYHDVLERLFFELLNTPKEQRNIIGHPFDLVPYLNGGLFSPQSDDFYKLNKITGASEYLNTLKISDKWFKEFFEFLETYNFTIDENTAFDQELSVDPEMLGRIFENLLAEIDEDTGESARKATGSFYTPREIVEYMVDESLLEHLKETTKIDEQKLKALISYGRDDDELYPLTDEEKDIVIKAIANLKILDPACGSGAFPIGVLQKLVYMLSVIDEDGMRWRNYQLSQIPELYRQKFERDYDRRTKEYLRKLEIIKNSIFGVDIQPIAVEVSRLRAFLTLIVEEEIDDTDEKNRGIEPLPNLEFKFICANTLIPAPEQNDDGALPLEDSFQTDLEVAIDAYFSSNSNEKERYLSEIHQLIKSKTDEKMRILIGYQEHEDERMQELLRKKNNKAISEQSKIMSLWDSYLNLFKNEPVGFFETKYFFPSVKNGFDIVIGNPPYVSLEKVKENKEEYKKHYQVFAPRGDLYTLFYERGLQLTKENGYLIYITSNKWMRAGYGEKLREYFVKKNPLKLLDFGGFKVFESATVDTNILLIQNAPNQNKLQACHFKNDYQKGESIAEYFEKNKVELTNLNSDTWFIGTAQELTLKEKIEKIGTPLKDWDININYGIKTGFNEAFIIDAVTKEKLIAEDPKSAEIIKPLLRGRDIKRYGYEFADKWLIVVKFGAYKYLAEKYPAIYKHLKQYEEQLKNRGQCKYSRSKKVQTNQEYPGQHHWLELDNNPKDDYLQEFEKEKVVWAETAQEMKFCIVDSNIFLDKTTFLLIGDRPKYIIGIMNSYLVDWYFRKFITSALGEKGIQLAKIYVERIPILKITQENKSVAEEIEKLVDQILSVKKQNPNADTSHLESQIDQLVYKLYDLTPEEVQLIENSKS